MSAKIIMGTIVSLGMSVIGALLYIRYKRDRIPKTWRRVGKIKRVNIYPVKSCSALQLQTPKTELNCELLGLRLGYIRDRGLILVDDDGNAISVTDYPNLASVDIKITGLTRITFYMNSMEPMELDFQLLRSQKKIQQMTATIQGNQATGMVCGERFDRWWSQAILQEDSGLHLLYYYQSASTDLMPLLRQESDIPQINRFCDGSSYLLINLASVGELSVRAQMNLNAEQFRANFELEMDTPLSFAEYQWNWIKIGKDAVFRVNCSCKKCSVPINDRNMDPLSCLKK